MLENEPAPSRGATQFTHVSTQEPSKIIIAGGGVPDQEVVSGLPAKLYALVRVGTADELRGELSRSEYDLVILNAVLPDMDSASVIHWITSLDVVPYLIVRAETDDDVERILALELGADDCVSLSCRPRELRARILSLFRRRIHNRKHDDAALAKDIMLSEPELCYSGWVLRENRRQLYSPGGDAISLTNAECLILSSLFSAPGAITDRLGLKYIGPDETGDYDDRGLVLIVSRLRKKIAKYGGQNLVETVRGRGYRLSTLLSQDVPG